VTSGRPDARTRIAARIDWADDAACRGMNPDWWHPERGRRNPNVAKAIAICKACPVIAACRDHAARHERQGIWAGVDLTGRVARGAA
jgi:WhiB family transcriptional regulator, redox-sensing transcriptional regulator